MDVASSETVLGDFDDVTFDDGRIATRFHRDGQRFLVTTAGLDGNARTFEVAYTFGVEPLQQYLLAFPDGRYQALTVCWDSRPAAAGGQRWFSLHPDETVGPGDPLHWAGPMGNWNHQCAECHSTDLHKGYDAAADRFDTTFAEIDVSCEACHGPGSAHVAWAEARPADAPVAAADDKGLTVRLRDSADRRWVFADDTGIARRDPPREPGPLGNPQVEACGRCHSRRSVLAEPYEHGRPLTGTHRPALLREGLYHADGQIQDEVYVWGSFVQSRMYAAGVTCTDCHHPHTTEVYGGPDGVCVRCHDPEVFAVEQHHRHDVGTPGASCVACHMPAKDYMVVDPRRDHSLRVPRPDLTEALGVPNACNGCHADRSAAWAAAAVEEWHGPREPHWGAVLAAGRAGDPEALASLGSLAADPEAPAIVRATATELLAGRPGALGSLSRQLDDESPLVRAAALGALDGAPPGAWLVPAAERLTDGDRLVRTESARVLAPVASSLKPDQRADLEVALAEYRAALEMDADRADAWLRAAVLAVHEGDLDAAEAALVTALERDPGFEPAAVNLADVYRVRGEEDRGEAVLRDVIARLPAAGDARHALGLLLVRTDQRGEAVEQLVQAAELRPEVPRYAFVAAVALRDADQDLRALALLLDARVRHPHDESISALLQDLANGR